MYVLDPPQGLTQLWFVPHPLVTGLLRKRMQEISIALLQLPQGLFFVQCPPVHVSYLGTSLGC